MKVLLAHRSDTVRTEVSKVFESLGWTVLVTEDGLEAERVCRAERPDVAVLDAAIGWPGEETLVEHMRSDSELCHIRLVVLAEELELRSALAGVDDGVDHVVGPATPAEIAMRVKQAGHIASLEARLDDHIAEVRGVLHADPLTGLLDRRFVARQLDAHVNIARRHGQQFSILLIDLDRLKEINDTHGHAAGDAALRALAAVLGERLRDADIAGRWGGDEFLVILPATDAEAALTVARDLMADLGRVTGMAASLTLSIGCAEWQEDDPAELVARADRALYEVKATGRNGATLAADRRVDIPVPDRQVLAATPGLRVLVVDDVEGIRSLLRVTLEGLGMEVVGEAGDGPSGVELATALRPDAVIMDWNMPGSDGIQATRELLADAPKTVVAAFTSTDDPRIHRALLEAGAAAHFNKRDIGSLMQFLADLSVSEPAA